jgi:hypothetical protein
VATGLPTGLTKFARIRGRDGEQSASTQELN